MEMIMSVKRLFDYHIGCHLRWVDLWKLSAPSYKFNSVRWATVELWHHCNPIHWKHHRDASATQKPNCFDGRIRVHQTTAPTKCTCKCCNFPSKRFINSGDVSYLFISRTSASQCPISASWLIQWCMMAKGGTSFTTPGFKGLGIKWVFVSIGW